ncbi:PKD domain-containing protein [Candidatus Acetothermia bacterium]|nr:PKD domain-containing protein [Candidatus Acetothermia bacterium]
MQRKFFIVCSLLVMAGLSGCAPMPLPSKEPPPDLSPIAGISLSCSACQSLNTGFAPLTVTLDASPSKDDHGIIATFWDFGNGMTATQPKVIQTYLEPGDYTVKLTVSDAKGQLASAQVVLHVIQKPIAFKTDRAENPYFIMERILPDRAFKLGETIKLKLQITPKRNLEYSYWREMLPPGLTPDYPQLEFHAFQLKEGKPIMWVYEVTIEKPGAFKIEGKGQAVDGPNSEALKLSTSLETAETAP